MLVIIARYMAYNIITTEYIIQLHMQLETLYNFIHTCHVLSLEPNNTNAGDYKYDHTYHSNSHYHWQVAEDSGVRSHIEVRLLHW